MLGYCDRAERTVSCCVWCVEKLPRENGDYSVKKKKRGGGDGNGYCDVGGSLVFSERTDIDREADAL